MSTFLSFSAFLYSGDIPICAIYYLVLYFPRAIFFSLAWTSKSSMLVYLSNIFRLRSFSSDYSLYTTNLFCYLISSLVVWCSIKRAQTWGSPLLCEWRCWWEVNNGLDGDGFAVEGLNLPEGDLDFDAGDYGLESRSRVEVALSPFLKDRLVILTSEWSLNFFFNLDDWILTLGFSD